MDRTRTAGEIAHNKLSNHIHLEIVAQRVRQVLAKKYGTLPLDETIQRARQLTFRLGVGRQGFRELSASRGFRRLMDTVEAAGHK